MKYLKYNGQVRKQVGNISYRIEVTGCTVAGCKLQVAGCDCWLHSCRLQVTGYCYQLELFTSLPETGNGEPATIPCNS